MFRDSLQDMCPLVYRIRHYLTGDVLNMLYYELVYSKIQFGILVWGTAATKYLNGIKLNMNKIIRAKTNSARYSPLSPVYKKLNFLKLTEIYELELAKFMHQLQNNKLPKLFQDLFCKIDTVHGHNTRHATKNIYFRPKVKNVLLKTYWPLKGLNFGQALTLFIKTKNLVPLPSKNTSKNFLLANSELT